MIQQRQPRPRRHPAQHRLHYFLLRPNRERNPRHHHLRPRPRRDKFQGVPARVVFVVRHQHLVPRPERQRAQNSIDTPSLRSPRRPSRPPPPPQTGPPSAAPHPSSAPIPAPGTAPAAVPAGPATAAETPGPPADTIQTTRDSGKSPADPAEINHACSRNEGNPTPPPRPAPPPERTARAPSSHGPTAASARWSPSQCKRP